MFIIALTCSCRQGRGRSGEVEPLSEMQEEHFESKVVTLELCGVTSDSAGFIASYEFLSDNCLCSSEPELVLSDAGKHEIRLNGNQVERVSGHYFIGGLVNSGNNVVEVRWEGMPGEVALSGIFDVVASEEGGWYVTHARVADP